MRKWLWLVIAMGFLMAMSGCDFLTTTITETVNVFVKFLAAPQGYVIDAKEGTVLEAVDVTLHYLSGAEPNEVPEADFTGTTDSDGYYSFDDVVYGTYELKAAKTGFVFIDQIIEVSGVAQWLPNIPGFTYDPDTDATTVRLILMWNSTFADCDAHLTYPDSEKVKYPDPEDPNSDPNYWLEDFAPTFLTPYDMPDSASAVNAGTGVVRVGFSPEDVPADKLRSNLGDYGRGHMDYTDANTPVTYTDYEDTTVTALCLDVDDTDGRGPETISIKAIPFDTTAYGNSTIGGARTGLPTLPDSGDVDNPNYYSWVGVMEYYIDAFTSATPPPGETSTSDPNATLSTVGEGSSSADAILYVMQGNSVLGCYTIPTYTSIKTASVVRINMFTKYIYDAPNEGYDPYETFQISPDIRVLQEASEIKALTPYPVNKTITLQGRKVKK